MMVDIAGCMAQARDTLIRPGTERAYHYQIHGLDYPNVLRRMELTHNKVFPHLPARTQSASNVSLRLNKLRGSLLICTTHFALSYRLRHEL